MRTKSYKLKVAPKGWTTYAKVKRRILPKVKVVDAQNGILNISCSKKVELGMYELELQEPNHAPITIKIEVI